MANGPSEFGRLLQVCGELLGRGTEDIFAIQVARVLVGVTSARCEGVRGPFDVVSSFREKGLVPQAIVDSWRLAGEGRSADVAPAIAFAAALYPRRVSRLLAEERDRRFQGFRRAFYSPALPDAAAVVLFLRTAGCFPARISDVEIFELLGDMSAADIEPTHHKERVVGAALYLATGPKIANPVDARHGHGILQNWLDDRTFVRFLRSNLQTPPSRRYLRVQSTRYGTPFWPGVRNSLLEEFPQLDPEVLRKAVEIEQILWRRRPDRIIGDDFQDHITDFWWEQIRKLTCGVPYFGFESHFVQWWTQCANNLANGIFRNDKEFVLIDDLVHAADKDPETTAGETLDRFPMRECQEHFDLTPERLRVMREGWRLVRTTFFPLQSVNPVEDNESLRCLLDVLWKHYLEKEFRQDENAETLRQIVGRFQGTLDENTAFSLIGRITNRLWAYNWARLRRASNQEIERQFLKSKPRVSVEPVHLSVAALARPVSVEDSLYWALAAQVGLRQELDPAHKDPWTLPRGAHELWHWITDPGFVGRLAQNPNALRSHKQFLKSLEVLHQSLPHVEAFQSLSRQVCDCLAAWRLETNHRSWIAPAWFAQGCPPDLRAAWVVVEYIDLLQRVDIDQQDPKNFLKILISLETRLTSAHGQVAGATDRDVIDCATALLRQVSETPSFLELEAYLLNWAARQVEDLVGSCGIGVYRQLRELFRGAVREWIVPVWYLIFVERIPFGSQEDVKAILRRLVVEVNSADERQVKNIINSIRRECGARI